LTKLLGLILSLKIVPMHSREAGLRSPKKHMVLALASILALPLAWAQQNSTVTFTSHANLVLVPVVVNNKSGTHISDLTKDDFEIREDAKSRSQALEAGRRLHAARF
jgi:hypothetical protein